jgi:hypothetical protein
MAIVIDGAAWRVFCEVMGLNSAWAWIQIHNLWHSSPYVFTVYHSDYHKLITCLSIMITGLVIQKNLAFEILEQSTVNLKNKSINYLQVLRHAYSPKFRI